MISIFKKLFSSQNKELTYSIDAESARALYEKQKNERYLNYLQRRKYLLKNVYSTIKNAALEELNSIIITSDIFPPHWINFIKWDSEDIQWFANDFKEEFELKGYTFDYGKCLERGFHNPRIRIGWKR